MRSKDAITVSDQVYRQPSLDSLHLYSYPTMSSNPFLPAQSISSNMATNSSPIPRYTVHHLPNPNTIQLPGRPHIRTQQVRHPLQLTPHVHHPQQYPNRFANNPWFYHGHDRVPNAGPNSFVRHPPSIYISRPNLIPRHYLIPTTSLTAHHQVESVNIDTSLVSSEADEELQRAREELIEQFTFKSKYKPIPNSPQSCSICFEQLRRYVKIRTLPCFHVFHLKCIDPWLKNTLNCPNCRTTINPSNINT